MSALGRRAVACAGWRWMAGMRALAISDVPGGWAGGRLALDATRIARDHETVLSVWYSSARHLWLPDLNDPATLGCLLALVREALGLPRFFVEPQTEEEDSGWASGLIGPGLNQVWDTEAEALVAALEAAPRDPDRA